MIAEQTPEIDRLWAAWFQVRSPEIKREIIAHYAHLLEIWAGRLLRKMRFVGNRVYGADELASYGYEGLSEAVDRFDPSKGFKFTTYASRLIYGRILDALRNNAWLPRSVCKAIKDGRTEVGVKFVSLESFSKNGGTSSDKGKKILWQDRFEDKCQPQPFAAIVAREGWSAMLSGLSINQKLILNLRYQEDMTFIQISKILDLSESRVNQMHTTIVNDLRARHGLSPKAPAVKMEYQKVCVDCETAFIGGKAWAERCPKCALEHDRTMARERERKKVATKCK